MGNMCRRLVPENEIQVETSGIDHNARLKTFNKLILSGEKDLIKREKYITRQEVTSYLPPLYPPKPGTGNSAKTAPNERETSMRHKLWKNYRLLVQNLESKSLCDELIVADLMNEDDRQEVAAENCESRSCDVLLQKLLLLPTFGKEEYDSFLEALRNGGMDFLVQKLETTDDSNDLNLLNDASTGTTFKQALLDNKEFLAREIDTKAAAQICIEHNVLSIHDYGAIFRERHEIKSSKLLLQNIIDMFATSFEIFRQALLETNCYTAVSVIDNYKCDKSPEKEITVAALATDTVIKVLDDLQSRDLPFRKIKMTIDLSENKTMEVKILGKLKSNRKVFDRIFAKHTQTEIISAKEGSVIIHLMGYNDLYFESFMHNEQKETRENICRLLQEFLEECDIADMVHEDGIECTVTILSEQNQVKNETNELTQNNSDLEDIWFQGTFIVNATHDNGKEYEANQATIRDKPVHRGTINTLYLGDQNETGKEENDLGLDKSEVWGTSTYSTESIARYGKRFSFEPLNPTEECLIAIKVRETMKNGSIENRIICDKVKVNGQHISLILESSNLKQTEQPVQFSKTRGSVSTDDGIGSLRSVSIMSDRSSATTVRSSRIHSFIPDSVAEIDELSIRL